MRKKILFLIFCVFLLPKLFAQNNALVCGSYYNTSYMDTLKGKSIKFPQQFLDSIQRFNVISYYQSFPSIKDLSLKSWITFICPSEKAEEFANYLITNESNVFSDVFFELPVVRNREAIPYVPMDYYWDKSRFCITTYYDSVSIDYMWHLKIIQADYAWTITTGNPNIKIAIIDNGFNTQHPDLIGKLNTYDPFDHKIINQPDSASHGTEVAAIAAGNTDDSLGWTASVGFNCGLVAYIDNQSVQSWVEKAVDAAFNQNVKVINFSLKGVGHPTVPTYMRPIWIAAIKSILDAGIVIVRSAGNDRINDGLFNRLPFSPVIDDRIIVVSATNFFDSHIDPTADPNIDSIPTFCHYPEVTICAPGYYLTTATTFTHPNYPFSPYPGYKEIWSGTSFSTPIVSGVCALMKSINPDLTVAEVKTIIQATADPIIDEYMYHGQLGAGRINAYKAVKAVNDCYTEPVLEKNITTNVTCSEPMRTSDTITIHNGAVLTINSTLKCAENVCIIVKPGGKLVVSNGILKNSCIENTWRGIVVEGNSTQSQMGNNLNQGIVYLNNAIIENAICGIKVGDQSDLSKSGGIVYATNTTFKNCKNAVLFAPYRNMNNNVEFANRSKFTGCNFIVDSLYTLGIFFDTHVKLLGVNGISFKGCSFNAETYLNLSGNGYACSGISALNSGFSVNPKCYPSIASGEVCAISDVELPSVFSGLDYGIIVQDGGSMNQVKISSTKFVNNNYGVYVSASHNVKLLNNEFVIGKNGINDVSSVGTYIEGYASNFRIEENKFLKNENCIGLVFGVKMKSTGSDNNVVYKNQFTNVDIAQHFIGENYSSEVPYNGLKSLCNEHIDNKIYDIVISRDMSSNINGINEHQNMEGQNGDVAAGNKFSSQEEMEMQYNNGGNYLYYYYTNNPNEKLISYSSTSISQEIAPENSCPSKLFGLYPETVYSELLTANLNYANLKYNYNQLIDAGNTEELLDLIQGKWSDDIW